MAVRTCSARPLDAIRQCGDPVEQRTRSWLTEHDFSGRTGVPAGHLRFCRARKDKRIHCVDLGLTYFVDDRPDVHAAIADVVPHRYLFGPQRPGTSARAQRVSDWKAAERLITAQLAMR